MPVVGVFRSKRVTALEAEVRLLHAQLRERQPARMPQEHDPASRSLRTPERLSARDSEIHVFRRRVVTVAVAAFLTSFGLFWLWIMVRLAMHSFPYPPVMSDWTLVRATSMGMLDLETAKFVVGMDITIIATLAVAVVASNWRPVETITDEALVETWGDYTQVASFALVVLAILASLTQLASNEPMSGVFLMCLSLVATVIAAASEQRARLGSLQVKERVLRRQLMNLASREASWADRHRQLNGAEPRRGKRGKRGQGWRHLLGFALAASVAAVALTALLFSLTSATLLVSLYLGLSAFILTMDALFTTAVIRFAGSISEERTPWWRTAPVPMYGLITIVLTFYIFTAVVAPENGRVTFASVWMLLASLATPHILFFGLLALGSTGRGKAALVLSAVPERIRAQQCLREAELSTLHQQIDEWQRPPLCPGVGTTMSNGLVYGSGGG